MLDHSFGSSGSPAFRFLLWHDGNLPGLSDDFVHFAEISLRHEAAMCENLDFRFIFPGAHSGMKRNDVPPIQICKYKVLHSLDVFLRLKRRSFRHIEGDRLSKVPITVTFLSRAFTAWKACCAGMPLMRNMATRLWFTSSACTTSAKFSVTSFGIDLETVHLVLAVRNHVVLPVKPIRCHP